MAIRKSDKAQAGVQPKSLPHNVEVATFSVGGSQSLSAGDVIQMIKVPKNAQVTYLSVSGGSGDALVSVGDGVSPARYQAYTTMSSAQPGQRIITTANQPYRYSTDDTIDIMVSTVSIGTITGGFHMTAHFILNP